MMKQTFYLGKENEMMRHEMVACFGKIKYPSEATAWLVFYRYYYSFGKRGKFVRDQLLELNCYHCKFCGSWHLGRQRAYKYNKRLKLKSNSS